jgi:hypothetical protein
MKHLFSLSKQVSFIVICLLLLNSVAFGDSLNVSAYGAVGDGITDDKNALQAAFDALKAAPDGSTLNFESNKTYLISAGILMDYTSQFTIEGNNSTLKMKGTAPIEYYYWVLYFSGCNNFTVNNLNFDGNRAERGVKEEFSHNLIIRGCHFFNFNDCDSNNAVCDGIRIAALDSTDTSTFSSDGTINSCNLNNNARQGISIINGWDITIKEGRVDRTNGLLPESGIDIEANTNSATPANKNIAIDGVEFYKNNGYAIQVSGIGKPTDIHIKKCGFSRNNNGAILMGAKDGSIKNNYFLVTKAKRATIDLPYSADGHNSGNEISDNEFNNNTYEVRGFFVHSGAGNNNIFKDNVFNNCIGDQWGNQMVIYNSTTTINNNVDKNGDDVQYYMP